MLQADFSETLFRESADNPDVALLEQALSGRGWLTYKRLRGLFPKWSDRYVRALAEAAGGRIISGQKGYALTRQVSADDYHACRSGWLSQVDRMRARIAATDREFHHA